MSFAARLFAADRDITFTLLLFADIVTIVFATRRAAERPVITARYAAMPRLFDAPRLRDAPLRCYAALRCLPMLLIRYACH